MKKNPIVKKIIVFAIVFLLSVIVLLSIILCKPINRWIKYHFDIPSASSGMMGSWEMGEESEEEEKERERDFHDESKNTWTRDKANDFNQQLKKLRKMLRPASNNVLDTHGSLKGKWIPRGPYNQPGCWETAEFDETDNTIWATTCGHYSSNQFIAKGSLKGDDFKLISSKLPNRFMNLVLVHLSNYDKRLLTVARNAGVYYTDDDGTHWYEAIFSDEFGKTIIPHLMQLIINRQDDQTLYATDGLKMIYRSQDVGKTFKVFKRFDQNKKIRLYSPRYNQQPGSENVYFYWGTAFYQITPSGHLSKLSNQWGKSVPSYATTLIGGDLRLFLIANQKVFYLSTDGGHVWKKILPPSDECWPGATTLGLSPDTTITDPSKLTLACGYQNPAFASGDLKDWITPHIWGQHQGRSAGQDKRSRIRIHADHQSLQFFYDKDHKLFTLHSTDGGLYKSYKDWTLTRSQWGVSWKGYPPDVYYNITLYGAQTTEVYANSMASGYHPKDIVLATQDQGTQTSDRKASMYGTQLSFVQSPYGDGHHFFSSGTGHVFWYYQCGNKKFLLTMPNPLYDADDHFLGTYKSHHFNILLNILLSAPLSSFRYYPDKKDPDNKLWFLLSTTKHSSILVSTTWVPSNKNYSTKLISLPEKKSTYKHVIAFTQAKQDPNILYIIQGKNIYQSPDSGETWERRSPIPFKSELDPSKCSSWVSDRDNNKLLFYCPSSSKWRSFYSSDGGSSIINVTGSMPNAAGPIFNAIKGTLDGRYVFAATSLGAYYFDVGLKHWFSLSGMDKVTPIFNARALEYIPSIQTMRFATWGSGIYDFKIETKPYLIQWKNDSVSADQIQSDRIRITWLLPDPDTYPNNPNTMTFAVTATQTGENTSATKLTCQFVYTPQSVNKMGHCILNGLAAHTTYLVTVVPHALNYQDGKSGTTTVMTKHIKIQWHTKSVSKSDVTQNSALIHWNPRLIMPTEVKQVAFLVTARFMNLHEQKDRITSICQSNHDAILSETPSHDECTLHGLRIGQRYQVTVVPHREGYIDGDAGVVVFKTKEKSDPKPDVHWIAADRQHHSDTKIIGIIGAGLVAFIVIGLMFFASL